LPTSAQQTKSDGVVAIPLWGGVAGGTPDGVVPFLKEENMKQQNIDIYNKVDNKQKLTYGEFITFVSLYGEVEFVYKLHKFGVDKAGGSSHGIMTYRLFDCTDNETKPTYFASITDFEQNVTIEGKNLEDIWHDVVCVNYLQ
jgi:hypothetical protein